MVDAKSEHVRCANPDCRVSETGKCVEGLEFADCPHFGRPPEDASDVESVVSRRETSRPPAIQLPSAEAMTTAQASGVLRASDARVITVIGPSEAGKTSLIASLYDLFHAGPVGGISYARSHTLHAFERTCHDARAASRRGTPHVNRTALGEVRFYHLDLSGSGVPESGLALLLADRAGEEYRSAADDLSTAAGFVEMARADCITVLVDGERLVDLGLRHNARSETVMILQALIEGGAIQPGQRLALVLTKLDVVLKSEDRDRVESDFASLRMRIQTLFSNVFSVISAFQVAASPRSDSVARGTGVADLLAFWIAPKQRPPAEARSRRIPDRAFARLSVAEE